MKQLLVITTPDFFAGEARLLRLLFERGLYRLHLRKPAASARQLADLLEAIPEVFHPAISLHDHFELTRDYAVGGVHLNRRNPVAPAVFSGRISRSCHTLQELDPAIDYQFLSPIFPSISKEGYGQGFDLEELKRASAEGIITPQVIALGGMDTHTIPQLRGINFGGVAVLGALWGNLLEDKVLNRFEHLKRQIAIW